MSINPGLMAAIQAALKGTPAIPAAVAPVAAAAAPAVASAGIGRIAGTAGLIPLAIAALAMSAVQGGDKSPTDISVVLERMAAKREREGKTQEAANIRANAQAIRSEMETRSKRSSFMRDVMAAVEQMPQLPDEALAPGRTRATLATATERFIPGQGSFIAGQVRTGRERQTELAPGVPGPSVPELAPGWVSAAPMASIISAQGALDQMVGLPSVTKLAAKAQLDKAREEYLAGVIDDAGLRSKVNQIIFTPEQAEARQPDGSVKLVAVAESPYAIWRTIKGDEASDAQAAAKLEADRNAAAISGVNRRVIEETAPSQIQAGRLAGPQAAATLEATQAGTAATLAQGQREAKATAFDKASLIPSLVNKGFAGEQARYRTLRTPSDLRIAARQVVEQYETFAKNPSLSGIGASFTPEDVITSWRSLVGPNLDPTVAHEVEQAIRGSLAYRGIGGAMAAPRTPTRTAGPPPATPQVPYGPPALAGSLGR